MRSIILILFFLISETALFAFQTKNSEQVTPYILDAIHENPGEDPPETQFNNPKILAEKGYNGQIINDFISPVTTISYDDFENGVFPTSVDEQQWLTNATNHTEAKIKKAHSAGIDLYYWTDLFVVPTKILDKYKSELARDDGKGIDINKPLTQKLLKFMLAKTFERYPELDGLVIRTGEIYTLDTPYHDGGMLCHSPEDYQVLISLLREEVCVKQNKKIFYRTWGFDGFHTDPEYYLKVTDAIAPHPNLIFSIKHNRYHRMNPFSSVLTLGKHPQIIEYSCQRSFEGKGAYPHYVAKGLIEGFEEYRLMPKGANKSLSDIIDYDNIKGLWTWSRGDGWAGPYIKNELWPELNAYVGVQWFKNPQKNEKEFIDAFAISKGLKGEDIARFRKIAWRSADAVLRGREKYVGETELSYDSPGRLYIRDEYMEGDGGNFGPLRDMIIEKNDVAAALNEKAEGIKIWKEIVTTAKTLETDDTALKEFLVTSCKYGLLKYQIVEQFWTVSLLGRQEELTGKSHKKRIIAALKKYDQLWQEWETLVNQSPSAATIFNDVGFTCYLVPDRPGTGMGTTIEKYKNRYLK
ncbi:hypothetical protein [Maribacter sp. 2210JD10-5]|uniref:hypothetical protein n=1 Tax=Maribacter sp. 2210JD10-5 TaxID=3386272 RepID=UPI0039BC43F8